MIFLSPFKSKSVLSNTLGNVLEWYDFTLYGILAVIIAKVYFPTGNPVSSILLTFTVFAVGFLMRPIGGIIYGHIGDVLGRKKALIISIIMMTIPTVALGIIPSYETMGITSSFLVAFVRLFQGLAVGGEFTGTMCFLVETAPANRRGMYGSYALVGVLAGILLGIGVIALVNVGMTKNEFASWGFRIPFLFSAVIGAIVLLLRHQLTDPKIFIKSGHKTLGHIPIVECLLNHKKKIFFGFIITIFNSYGFYILMIYVVTYFNQVLKFPLDKAAFMNLYMVAITLIFVPLFGLLSDYVGRKKVMGASALSFILLAYPMDIFFLNTTSILYIYLGQTLICIMLASYLGPMSTTLAELMPTKIRFTAISLAYNSALALFGGTAPLLNTYLIEKLHIPTAPGILLTISAIVSFIGILLIKETYRKPLS